MKSEREMFEVYFKTVWKGIDLIQTIGEDFAFKLLDGKYVERIVEEHWRTWTASTQREGYKLVPVKINDEIESAMFSSVVKGEMPCDIYKAMIGAV